jgi:DNA phosphorothioation-dependent restriction protein DptG
LTPLQRQQQQMQQQFQAQFAQFQAQQEFNQVAGNYEPDVRQSAEQLMRTWQQNGYSGWKPVDALTYAAGQKALAQMQQAQASQTQSAQFNQLQNTVVRNQAAPPAPAPKGKGLPSNFDSLPANQRMALLDDMEDFPI